MDGWSATSATAGEGAAVVAARWRAFYFERRQFARSSSSGVVDASRLPSEGINALRQGLCRFGTERRSAMMLTQGDGRGDVPSRLQRAARGGAPPTTLGQPCGSGAVKSKGPGARPSPTDCRPVPAVQGVQAVSICVEHSEWRIL